MSWLVYSDLAVVWLISSRKSQTIAKYMTTKYKHFDTSLRKLPWSNSQNPTMFQSMISATIYEWYNAKHRKTSVEELEMINSLMPIRCHHCTSKSFIRYGYRNGLKVFKCKECNKKFTNLTNTIFDSKRIPISEWIEYLLHLFEYHSIITSSRDNRNSSSTGHYWLEKVFLTLKDCQKDIRLKNKIYLDEIFFPVIKSKIVTKDGKKLRGISKNKICVAVAMDEDSLYIKVEPTSKPSDTSTWNALGKIIQPGSHLIHDKERSHGILERKLNLTSEVYDTKYTKGLKDSENPLDPINNIHSLIKRFMKQHGGYDRDNLQDWMNLIWFILSSPSNVYEKIEKFFKIAITTPQRVKYRDVMSKKH